MTASGLLAIPEAWVPYLGTSEPDLALVPSYLEALETGLVVAPLYLETLYPDLAVVPLYLVPLDPNLKVEERVLDLMALALEYLLLLLAELGYGQIAAS